MVIFRAPQLYLRVKYPLRFFVCHVHPLHSSTNQELFKKYVEPLCRNTMGLCPRYHLKLKYPLPFSVSYFQLITRPQPIMLKILPIMLLSIAQKSSLLCSKLYFQNQDYAQEMTVLLEYIVKLFY